MAKFEVGKIYWGIRTGYGFDRICRVKLTQELYSGNHLAGYAAKDMGEGAVAGTAGIELTHLFYTKAEAEDYRDQMAAVQVDVMRKQTDTPEKMLAYLLNHIRTDVDGYCDDRVNEDIRARAQELFGIKLG